MNQAARTTSAHQIVIGVYGWTTTKTIIPKKHRLLSNQPKKIQYWDQKYQQQQQFPNFRSSILARQKATATSSDLDIVFGSESTSNVSGGVSWGDDDDNDDEEHEIGSYRKRKQASNARVQELLAKSDNEMKSVRKQQTWGVYANVTSTKELNDAIQKQQNLIQLEFQKQQSIALQQGVLFEVLEPREDEFNFAEAPASAGSSTTTTTSSEENGGNIRVKASGRATRNPWFAEMDEELRAEWEQLTSQDTAVDDGKSKSTIGSSKQSKKRKKNKIDNTEDDINVNEDDDEADNSMFLEEPDDDSIDGSFDDDALLSSPARSAVEAAVDIVQEKNSGKMIARDALSGIRVGSAGGWTLEVFPGDYVVHRKYGIGRFERTCLRPKTKLTKDEKLVQSERRAELLSIHLRSLNRTVTSEDIQTVRSRFGTQDDIDPISNPQTTVLEISYYDAVVHVPIDRAYRISRYRAGDSVVKPRLSRVKNGEAWSKTKRTVEENTLALAQDVLALYATRETLKRQPLDPSLEETVQQFAQTTFPYKPTPDQNKCFEDVENDMIWRERPMDRLICGDVGFGKTEVAIRALYRACVNNQQCALLAPTGVLAAQHYKNIVKRMGPDTPFNISCALLRGGMGRNTKNGREIRDNISTGQIQLIVGTHALLSNDLKFNKLGLLVIDEEQRFGVKQKERLKLISNGVDVLTLSATPIPRTLQMSLSGIRDTSTIRSPPPMRKPVITYVQDFQENLVKTAIATELERGGQCYYVVPRISMLDGAESLIRKLFPKIRVIQAHGRLNRNGAEENVASFAEGRYDILLATTVIENGVDIPTVNTIIVQNSQAFGMSTLYQLRGRVGRSDQQAYAYFLHRDESITEQAALRLQAIGELNELGSGFDVANRDLEIRGAGSLLGTEQSGMATKVGFDLYMRLLKKSIRKLRELDLPIVPRTNILIHGLQSTSINIPVSYIPDDKNRLAEESKARIAESTSKLVEITNSWKELYGPIPASVQNQLKTMHLHACTRRLGIDLVGQVEVDVVNASDSEMATDTIDSTVMISSNRRIDLILRSPGLRPRHLHSILVNFPKMALPRGLNVVFTSRFTVASSDDNECVIVGGRVIDPKVLIHDDNYSMDRDDGADEEDWDTMDDEELEAMKDISSAVNVQTMDDIDIEQYPRFVLVGGADGNVVNVDKILKFLLPLAKTVYEKQEEQASNAQAAAALREKQNVLRQRKKVMETLEAQRLGYNY